MIIKSILDNDLYKFTMQHAVMELFPYAKAKYQFINRGSNKFPDGFADKLRNQIQEMSGLALTRDEKEFFQKKCYYLPPTYFDFLQGYRYDPDEVKVWQQGGDLYIEVEGYWYRTILWEVPLMALISELYFKEIGAKPWPEQKIIDVVREKAEFYNALGITYADFGTRRRYSLENHDRVVRTLAQYGKPAFVGTSNVYFAYKYNLTPIGTQAHEWFMFHAAKYGFKVANELALEHWAQVFQGSLGIALADTFTSKAFFQAFNMKLAKLFDGVRQDSGDPIEFAQMAIDHYKKLRIDPTTKTIIFSDSLNPQRVKEIVDFARGKIRVSFGIGTNFTNDVGVEPLNIVIKMIAAQPKDTDYWIPTIKLSDDRGKYTGDPEMIEIAKKILHIG